MAANTDPIFPLTPIVGKGIAVATSTTRTQVVGTGTNTACTATTTNGLRIDAIWVQATATTAAASIMIFIYDGTNQDLFDEIPVSAVTASTTVPAFQSVKYYTALVLPPTYRIFACSTIGQNTNVIVLGGAF